MRSQWPTGFIIGTIWYCLHSSVYANKTWPQNDTEAPTPTTEKPLTVTMIPPNEVTNTTDISKPRGSFENFRVVLENCESSFYIEDSLRCIFEQNGIDMNSFLYPNCTDGGRSPTNIRQLQNLVHTLAKNHTRYVLAVVSTPMLNYVKSWLQSTKITGMVINSDLQVVCPHSIKTYYDPEPDPPEDPDAPDTLLWADPLNENLHCEADFNDEDCWFKSVFPQKVIPLPIPVMDGIEKICTVAAVFEENGENYLLLSTLHRLLLRQMDLFSKTTLVPNCTCYNEIPHRDAKEYFPQDIPTRANHPKYFSIKQAEEQPEIVNAWTVQTRSDIQVTPQITHAERRFDMKTQHIYVATYHHPPYMFVTSNSHTKQQNFSGYLIDILDILAKTYNFTYTVLVPDELEKGDYIKHRWTGVIGMINRSEAEIGLSDFILNAERADAVAFSSAFIDFQYTGVLIRRPTQGDLANKLGVYLKPFGEDVWYASLVIVCLSVMFIHIVFRIRKWVGGMTEEEYPDELQTSRLLLLGVQAVAQQGCEFDINGFSSRIIFFLLWIFTMLIHIYYNANLMSYLTVNAIEWPFETYEGVVYSGYKLGLIRDSQRMEMFMTSPMRLHQAIWRKVSYDYSNKTIETDLEIAAKRSVNEKYALLHADPFLQYVSRNTCEYGTILKLGDWTPVYPIFKKNSSLIRHFDVMLRRLYMTGMQDFYRKKWFGRIRHCETFKEDFTVMSVYSVATAFMILGAGMGLAFIFIVIENMQYKYGKKKVIHKSDDNPIYTVSHAIVAE